MIFTLIYINIVLIIVLSRKIIFQFTAAELLGLDSKKFIWALINYCLIVKGSAVRKKHTCEEAKEARDVLANTLYQRLVDWIVNNINYKLSMTRSL